MPEPLPAGLPTAHEGGFWDLKDSDGQKELEEAKKIEQLLTVLLPGAYEVQKNPKLSTLHQEMMGLIQAGQERLKTLTDWEADTSMYPNSWGDIPVNLVEMLIGDKDKLWQSADLDSFKWNGKYNQVSLKDDGTLIITMIKPGVLESIELQVPQEKVLDIRTYIQGNWFKWGKEEWYENEYSWLGGAYVFHRIIPLLDPEVEKLSIQWDGRHTEPVITGGPFQINDTAKIVTQ